MYYFSIRATQLYGFLFCIALLVTGVYLEYSLDLVPCPLCIVQRVIFLTLGLFFLVGLFFRARLWLKLHALIICLVSLTGALVAGRQLWLQHLPADQHTSCGPGLGYMLNNLPLNESLSLLFQGSGDCAAIQWQLLGMSMPAWSLICFVAIFILAAINLSRA